MAPAVGVIGAVAGGLIAHQGAKKQAKTIQQVASEIYKPKYSSEIDKLVYDLITQQAQYQPQWDIYQNVVNQILSGYKPEEYQQYLTQYLTQGFQPTSSDLYQYYLDKLTQNVRQGLAQRGLLTSPYGAGIESQAQTEYAMQNLLQDWARRSQALQNYLAGQTGLQNLGRGALQTALALEELKSGWFKPIVSQGLQYMGLGGELGNARASILSTLIPQAGQEWAQLGQALSNVLNQLYTPRTTTTFSIPSLPPLSSVVYMPGTFSNTYSPLAGSGFIPGIGYVMSMF